MTSPLEDPGATSPFLYFPRGLRPLIPPRVLILLRSQPSSELYPVLPSEDPYSYYVLLFLLLYLLGDYYLELLGSDVRGVRRYWCCCWNPRLQN